MLIPKENGSGYFAGAADVLCIVVVPSGRYHVSFWEESPLPGPVPSILAQPFIRLKSKMHHTGGADTLAEAQIQLDALRQTIDISDENVLRSSPLAVDDPMTVQILPNWISARRSLADMLMDAWMQK